MLGTILTANRPMGDDVESRANSVRGEERLTLQEGLMQKGWTKKSRPLGGFFLNKPGDDLLSHGETPHYHRR